MRDKLTRLEQPEPSNAAEAGVAWTRSLPRRAEVLVANPLFAYGAILVLQLRVIWNIWQYKDLTYGDTASYFVSAASWAHGLHDNIIWSPLYTNFWGTILAVIGDVYAAAMVHRIAIVLAAAMLVLALMRALLEPALALLLTVWWVVLPPNFNVLYEVHLFGLLPILVAALIVRRSPGRGAFGVALAVLAGTTLLLRNELVMATAIFAIAIVVREFRERRVHKVPFSAYVRAYGVPLAMVFLLAGGAYARSTVQGDIALSHFRGKHTLNVCQIYAFNYQQRHPTRFPGNPFIDCKPLMRRTFGRPLPSFLHAARANPGAMADFVAWNARLLPTGLQVSLFGATVTGDNPDYIPVQNRRFYPVVPSLVLLVVLIAGLAVMLKDREFWRRTLARGAWAFLVLGAVAITTFVVALTQRPRPEYMYGLIVGVLALTGLCTSALLRRWGGHRFVAPLAVGVTLVLCVSLPSYYHPGPRPLHDAIERLQVIRESLQQPGSVLVTTGDGQSMCFYLADMFDRYCTSPSWPRLKAQLSGGRALRDVLAEAKATAIYVDPTLQADPAFAPLLASPRSAGWLQVAEGAAADGRWSILIRARLVVAEHRGEAQPLSLDAPAHSPRPLARERRPPARQAGAAQPSPER